MMMRGTTIHLLIVMSAVACNVEPSRLDQRQSVPLTNHGTEDSEKKDEPSSSDNKPADVPDQTKPNTPADPNTGVDNPPAKPNNPEPQPTAWAGEKYTLWCEQAEQSKVKQKFSFTGYGCRLQEVPTRSDKDFAAMMDMVAKDLGEAVGTDVSMKSIKAYDENMVELTIQSEVAPAIPAAEQKDPHAYQWHVWLPEASAAKAAVAITFTGVKKGMKLSRVRAPLTAPMAKAKFEQGMHFGKTKNINLAALGVDPSQNVTLPDLKDFKNIKAMIFPIANNSGAAKVGVKVSEILGVRTTGPKISLNCVNANGEVEGFAGSMTLDMQSGTAVIPAKTECKSPWIELHITYGTASKDFVTGKIEIFSAQDITPPEEDQWIFEFFD